MTAQIGNYLRLLEIENGCLFELHSFTGYSDFKLHNDANFDVAIIDYYLTKRKAGTEILEELKNVNEDCQTIVISQARNMETAVQTKKDGFDEYVHKEDRFAMPRMCFSLSK